MNKLFSKSLLRAIGVLALVFFLPVAPHAADHGDAPIASNNQSTDIADVFAFLDPKDNSRLILGMTQRGFIAAGENANFGIFDQFLQYQFGLETTGDAQPDQFINITFTPVEASGGPQTATIELPSGQVFSAPSTRSSTAATAPAQVVTTDPATGVLFFAGLVDDPFFFDIPAFGRFVASVLAGAPDPTQLQRGRDSFAGYNVMGIALSVPLSLLELPTSIIGVNGVIRREAVTLVHRQTFKTFGRFRQVERMGNPAVNVALVPFSRKDEYNFATPKDDANGQFADDIVATLTALGTDATNIAILANVAVTQGDYLRLDTSIANTGPMGGTNPEAGFPNGRRLADDTIDTLLFFIANQNVLGDSVDANDVPLGNAFPFFAPSQQPRAPGVIDDNTRN
jgi:Domain of unknown function (DUF4331)